MSASCRLTPAALADRRERWLRLADEALLRKRPTGAGVRLVYRAGPGVERELGELLALERECCGWASWRLERTREGDLALDVSAAADDVEVVRELFGLGAERP